MVSDDELKLSDELLDDEISSLLQRTALPPHEVTVKSRCADL